MLFELYDNISALPLEIQTLIFQNLLTMLEPRKRYLVRKFSERDNSTLSIHDTMNKVTIPANINPFNRMPIHNMYFENSGNFYNTTLLLPIGQNGDDIRGYMWYVYVRKSDQTTLEHEDLHESDKMGYHSFFAMQNESYQTFEYSHVTAKYECKLYKAVNHVTYT